MAKAIAKKKTISKKPTPKPKVEVDGYENIVCLKCHKTKKRINFYSDMRKDGGVTPYCKDCLIGMATDNPKNEIDKRSIIKVLELIGRPYIHSVFKNVVIKDISEGKKLGEYLRVMNNPNNKGKTFIDSDAEAKIIEVDVEDDEMKEYSSIWNGTFTPRELATLNRQYDAYNRDYALNTVHDQDNARKMIKASFEYDRTVEDQKNGKASNEQVKMALQQYKDLTNMGKFSAKDRLDNSGFTCFSTIFSDVEKEIWIKPYVPDEKDSIDLVLEQMKNLRKSF